MPAIMTGVIGVLSGLTLATYNQSASQNRFFLEKQVNVADAIAQNFSVYIENFRRIVILRRMWIAEKRDPTEDEQKVFRAAVDMRNIARDRLFSALDASSIYFDDTLSKLANNFREWDETQAVKTIEQLPEISEWQRRRVDIVTSIRGQLPR